MNKIVANRIQTPDGTILQSFYQSDTVEYVDKNGLTYIISGGLAYLSRNYYPNAPYTEASVYIDDDFDKIRTTLHWYSSDQTAVWKPLREFSREEIRTMLNTQTKIPAYIRTIFEKELTTRSLNNDSSSTTNSQ